MLAEVEEAGRARPDMAWQLILSRAIRVALMHGRTSGGARIRRVVAALFLPLAWLRECLDPEQFFFFSFSSPLFFASNFRMGIVPTQRHHRRLCSSTSS